MRQQQRVCLHTHTRNVGHRCRRCRRRSRSRGKPSISAAGDVRLLNGGRVEWSCKAMYLTVAELAFDAGRHHHHLAANGDHNQEAVHQPHQRVGDVLVDGVRSPMRLAEH